MGNSTKIKREVLFRWIGGKSWLNLKLQHHVESLLIKNSNISVYAEPFVGGLGSFLAVHQILKKHGIKEVFLNDINSVIINFYECVKINPELLIEKYSAIEEGFNLTLPKELSVTFKQSKDGDLNVSLEKIAKSEAKEQLSKARDYYNSIRSSLNRTILHIVKPDFDSAANFYFVQNHCFNGVFRVSSTGYHNVPFQWSDKKVDIENIRQKVLNIHRIFNDFEIHIENKDAFDFIRSLQNESQKTLYYFDPPYINSDGCKDTMLENQYNEKRFSYNEQIKLINTANSLEYFIYSNHDKEFIVNNLKADRKEFVARKNIISANKESRKKDAKELLAVKGLEETGLTEETEG